MYKMLFKTTIENVKYVIVLDQQQFNLFGAYNKIVSLKIIILLQGSS
jgi:hypothetical protein